MEANWILNLGVWSTLENWVRPSRVKSDTIIPASARLEKLNDQVFEVFKPTGSERPCMEIVFFHGLQPEASSQPHLTTWLSGDKSELWLNWLHDDNPDIRVLIVSYDTSMKRTENEGLITDTYIAAENLVHNLTGSAAHVGQDGCPIILVGHCLGGLVLKEVCMMADRILSSKHPDEHHDRQVENVLSFLENVKGVFFYATPHHGAIMRDLSASSSNSSREGLLVKDLAPFNEQAQRRNEHFQMLRQKWKWKAAGVGEGRKISTDFTGFVVYVPEASSRSGVDGMRYYTVPTADHFSISRPTDKTSASFNQLWNFIEQLLEEDQKLVASPFSISKDVVGMHEVVQEVRERLKSTKQLGIIGMGGIGKTTLVENLYENIKGDFQYASLVHDVKEKMGDQKQISHLQNLILAELTVKGARKVGAGFHWKRLENQKILVILDDVERQCHVKMTNEDVFSKESRVIVTSRNKMFLETESFEFHHMKLLSDPDSYKLISLHAFGKEEAPDDFRYHVKEVLKKCGNLPLAIEVVGSSLFGRGLIHWTEMTETIAGGYSVDGSYPDELWSILRRSFDSLGGREQEMFLDIATCFHGMYIADAKKAWKFMNRRSAESGWQNLMNRCLAKKDHLRISMHELLRDLGKSIARIGQAGSSPIHTRVNDVQTAKELFCPERSRVQILKLYDRDRRNDPEHLDIRVLHEFQVLKALWLDEKRRCDNLPELLTYDFIFPPQLTYVQIRFAGTVAMNGICQIPGLRCLILDNGVEELPSSLGHLVHLEFLTVSSCSIKVIPGEIAQLRSLQHLDIFWCHELTIIPTEISQLRRLRYFVIRSCASLHSLPSSITQLGALQTFSVYKCDHLRVSFSLLCKLRALKHISKFKLDCRVDGWYELRVTDEGRQWVYLVSSAEAPQLNEGEWPSMNDTIDVGIHVQLWDCGEETRSCVVGFQNVAGSLSEHQQLRMDCLIIYNILGDIDWVSTLCMDDFRELQSLEIIRCREVAELPPFGPQFSALGHFSIYDLPLLDTLPELCELQGLEVLVLVDLLRLDRLPESLGQLRKLKCFRLQRLHSLSGLPESIGHLQALMVMELIDLPRLDRLPESLGELTALRDLTIYRCACLKSPRGTACNWGLRSIERLTLDSGLPSLGAVTSDDGRLSDVESDGNSDDGDQSLETSAFDTYRSNDHCWEWFLGCFRVKENSSAVEVPKDSSYFPKHQQEYRLVAAEILEAAVHGKFPKLKYVALTLTMGDVELFANIGWELSPLERLEIVGCSGLMKLPESCGQLGSLKVLKIEGCRSLVELPESVRQLTALEQLEIKWCPALLTLPTSCGEFGSLKLLKIAECDALVELPASVGQLSTLEQLEIADCPALLTLPESRGEFASLKLLKIKWCNALLELPEWVGQLPALEHLEIVGCKKLTTLKGSIGQVRTLERLIISAHLLGTLPHENLAGLLHSIVVVERGSLKRLTIKDFESSDEELSASVVQLPLLEHLDLVDCRRIRSLPHSIGQICGLKCLTIERCWFLKELPKSIGQLGLLKRLVISVSPKIANLGNFLAQVEALEDLQIDRNTLAKLTGHLGQLRSLKRLTVESFGHDRGELPDSLGQLGVLEELAIRNDDKRLNYLEDQNWRSHQESAIRKLPDSIGQLAALKHLEISGFEEITQLPATVGELSRLERIVVRHCPKLEAWRPSSQHLQHVLELELTYEDPERRFPNLPKGFRGRDNHIAESMTILQRQDLHTMVEEERSLLEAAVKIERVKNS